MKALDDCLTRDGILGLYHFDIAPAMNSVDFCKAGDKSVLASMNQLVFQVKMDFLHMGRPLQLVNHDLHRTLLSPLKGQYPIEVLVALAKQ